ncbi:MAG: DUF444 family protein [Planctomycetota bacterium]|nr:DUF444 family protein [Planctomycetota bacterium]
MSFGPSKWNEAKQPQSDALVVCVFDRSGSMGTAKKDPVRLQTFWIETWRQPRHHEGPKHWSIVHDVQTVEVDTKTFFTLRTEAAPNREGSTASAPFDRFRPLSRPHPILGFSHWC